MKALKLIFLSAMLTLFGSNLVAQEKGEIRFFVNVDNGYFEIEINDTMLLKRYKDSLPAGNYSAKVWSPGYVVNRIDFTVVAGKSVEKHVNMVKNNNYMEYELAYKDYRMQFHKQFTVPLAVTLTSAVTSGVFAVNAYTLKKKLTVDIDLYHKSPVTSEIDNLKERIFENNKKYNRSRSAFYINTGFTFALIGGTIWSYRNFNKNNTEPTFNKESPFKDKYSLNITPYGCSLAIRI